MISAILWGGTGQAKVIREALDGQVNFLAIFDKREISSPFSDIPIFYGEVGFDLWERDCRQALSDVYACVAVGGSHGQDRLKLLHWLSSRGYPPLTVRHPQAYVAKNAKLGIGCQLLALSVVGVDAKLGDAVIVNTGASVDHDCIVGDGVHIAPGAVLTGEVCVGEFSFIGAGAIVLPRLRIGTGAIVGAGAVVTKNIPSGETVVGNPARKFLS